MPLYTITFKVIKRKRKTDGALAIDDILLANRACTDSLQECSFESNACYANTISTIEGTYSWFRQKGESLYSDTGPKTDHTTGSVYGHYMYLDSYNASDGDIAYSQGPSVNVNEESCLKFWYHMYGTDVGRLNVTLNKNVIWSDNGDKGDNWNLAKVDIDSQGYLTFEFVGIYGSGIVSDIAVDDILLLPGSCSGLIDHQKICVDLNDGLHAETYCSKDYLDLANFKLLFNPEKTDDYCSSIYYQTKSHLLNECKNRTDSQKCWINLSTDVSSHPECFRLYEIRIHHTCKVSETTTVSSFTALREVPSTGMADHEFVTQKETK
ncbi:MAM and LDL-receptor class A domain-containing protein 1-like [Mytilus californianus]|uniref:MAM and LDL-receptor class A domain-containing protein 1-like n=1 Tax=Mytilus californianus TaxID=6549 RepID=UPI002247E4E7|nr:MAM and LDL-receptor class A domain-containing protein 1-like [Mytilus californianus]